MHVKQGHIVTYLKTRYLVYPDNNKQHYVGNNNLQITSTCNG